MKAIVLAGGFAKRMWPLTKDTPKHLLLVAGKPMIEYVIEELEQVRDIDTIYVSTNSKFENQFQNWLNKRNSKKKIEIFIEKTNAEEEKLGSIGGLNLLIKEKGIDEETLIIGGDNLFEFKMINLIEHLEKKGTNIVVLDDIHNFDEAKEFGVVEIDDNHKIISFNEKPPEPKTTLVATACYILTKKGIQEISKYLEQGGDADKMGHFIEWLCKNDTVYGFTFDGRWFDIGSIEMYNEANEYFSKASF